ncbi:hypothetical protein [Mucilaginibacter sp. UR6-11]|uniref:hypothetical protein n=1 Tax=Mucilaginibacter sp. UR6-11 TaxID=1435644 RepID=UPI001E5BDB98|nr:hypothetical protein [Mucilaginibacter sp. UR6-11]MCC8423912.1 hypothetical protein [Mucilaginibacter sp. UR6-11]
MKKIFLISATLILSALAGFAQELKPVKIDSVVTVSMPAAYQKTDTLGQQVFSSNSSLGYVVVLRTPNAKNTAPLQRENDLDRVLKENVKSIQAESSNASAQYVRDTTIGKLKAKTFTLQTDNGQGDIQFRNIVLLYTNAASYVFEYVYPNARKEMINGEYKSFINSIKLSPELQRNDQYISNAKSTPIVLIVGLAGGGLLIAFAVGFYIQRKKRMELE